MSAKNRIRFARLLRTSVAVAITVTLLSLPVIGSASKAEAVGQTYYPVSGAGSTWSANALQQWIRNVWDNYRWKVTYDDSGSSAGRQLFAQGTVDFAVSEIPYALTGSDSADPRPSRQFSYIPIVAGGTSFMYNLVIGGQRVTNLRLSGETVAKIFTGVITKWNDPIIAADNPKLALPGTPIIPVVRSDGSGTTAQFTAWMRAQYTPIWNAYCVKAGKANCGITSNYPVASGSAFISQSGSNGVSGYVAQGQSVGSITYVEYSYARNSKFPVAKLLNTAGYYTEPTASNVAVALLGSAINNDPNSVDYLTQKLTGVYNNPDPRSYPLSSYSYLIVPTAIEAGSSFTEDKGLTLADFASYFLCEGQQQAEVLGYSPLPINLAQSGLEQVQKIPGGNPANKNISKCNNPTFSPDGTNKLATTAPQPPACDQKGADQCLTGTGGAQGTATAASGSGGGAGTSGSANGTDAAGAGGVDGTGTGGVGVAGLSGSASLVVSGAPVDLPVQTIGFGTIVAMAAAGVLLMAVILLPPVIARQRAAIGVRGPRGSRAPQVRRRLMPRINLRVMRRKGGGAVVTITQP